MIRRKSEDADDLRRGVDAICKLAGWTRRELAERLGVGETVFRYYERDTAPQWLVLALIGLSVGELGLPLAVAHELIGDVPSPITRAISRAE